jgi:hypothetical protein
MTSDKGKQNMHFAASIMTHLFAQLHGDVTNPPEEFTTWTDITPDSTTGTTTLETPEMCEKHGGRRYRQQKYLHFVRDAVHAVAQALHNLQESLCGPGVPGVCEDMRHIDSDLLRTYLANVTFNGESTAYPVGKIHLTHCTDSND